MSDPLSALQPALLWERFGELTRIARPPKEEAAAREHVLAWAAARSLESAVDEEGNTAVRAPATRGREDAPVVVLQAHLDMVCERDPESPFDPREGRIDVRVEGDWVRAEGTTLGADNGIGVAAALAVVDDPALEHGPLELLFTVSEEQGLDGAKALDPALVRGRLLLNLDGTSDGALTIGCAGSDHTHLVLQLHPEPAAPGEVVSRIEVSGARGGHSGGDVGLGRANAIKALGRVLASAPVRLGALEGGQSRNALPRAAHAVVAVDAEAEKSSRAAMAGALDTVVREHAGSDDALVLTVEPAALGAFASADTSRRVLDLLNAAPSGVLAMNPGLHDPVQTSTSLTTARTNAGVLTLGSMTRSSNAAALDDVLETMRALGRLGGADIQVRRSYPPWEPNLDSPLLATARQTQRRLFGSDPTLVVVHGGLECAVLGQRLPGIQMLSIGPEMTDLHAPGERVRISSTQRFYVLLGALLDDLS